MNNNRRLRLSDDAVQPLFIEYVDDDRLDTQRAQGSCLIGRAGRADHMPAIRDQQAAQPATDRAARAGNQDSSIRFAWHMSLIPSISRARYSPRIRRWQSRELKMLHDHINCCL
jgi:hypothetical protein